MGVIFCHWAWFRTVAVLSAATAAIDTLGIPVGGVFASALVLDEPVGLAELLALALVVGGLAILVGGPGSRAPESPAGLRLEGVKMQIPRLSTVRHGVRRFALRFASILAILAAALGCAAPARIEVPAELPLVTYERIFQFRWALQPGAARTRAIGLVRPSFDTEFHLTFGLYGVDTNDRIVSRGTTYVQSDFNRQAAPFSVDLTPTGQEARYELRLIDYHPPGGRGRR